MKWHLKCQNRLWEIHVMRFATGTGGEADATGTAGGWSLLLLRILAWALRPPTIVNTKVFKIGRPWSMMLKNHFQKFPPKLLPSSSADSSSTFLILANKSSCWLWILSTTLAAGRRTGPSSEESGQCLIPSFIYEVRIAVPSWQYDNETGAMSSYVLSWW